MPRSGRADPPPVDGALPSKCLTVAECAELLSISERTIRRRIAEGEIGIVRIGRSVRIPIDTLSEIFPARNLS